MNTAVLDAQTPRATLPPAAVPFGKRTLDVCLSGIGLLASSPIWLALAAAIKLEDGGPVFYRQDASAKADGVLPRVEVPLDDPRRRGHVGALQATRERPARDAHRPPDARDRDGRTAAALEHLRGDMSFVGPRALRPGEIEVLGDGRAGAARRGAWLRASAAACVRG